MLAACYFSFLNRSRANFFFSKSCFNTENVFNDPLKLVHLTRFMLLISEMTVSIEDDFFHAFCVCVKCIMLCNCLYFCSSCFYTSCVQNIRASHIHDFGPWHNMKRHFCSYTTSLSHQKMDSVISKNNWSVRPGFSLKKANCGLVYCSVKIIQTVNLIVINN